MRRGEAMPRPQSLVEAPPGQGEACPRSGGRRGASPDAGEAWESARQEFEAATRPQERSCTRERSETRPQGRAQDVCGSIRSHPRPWHLIFVEYDPHIEAGAQDARAGEAGAPEGRGFELVGRSPRQSTALPSENGPTLMSALGAVRGSSLRQDASGNNVPK